MKRIMLFILLGLCLALPGCGKESVSKEQAIAGSALSVSNSEPKNVRILSKSGKDLTPESAWPTLHVGESLTVHAETVPAKLRNPVVEWYTTDPDGKSLSLKQNKNGSVTITCIGATLKNVALTVSVNGVSARTTIYIRDDVQDEGVTTGNSETALTPRVEKVRIYDENNRDLTPLDAWPTLCPGETLTLHAVVYPSEIRNPKIEWSCYGGEWENVPLISNPDGSVTFYCVNTDPEVIKLTATCYGAAETIQIYQRELTEVQAEIKNRELSDVNPTDTSENAESINGADLKDSLVFSDEKLLIPKDGSWVYYYAKVTNTGNEPVNTFLGKLTGYSADKQVLDSYVATVPGFITLYPGEYAYIAEELYNGAMNWSTVTSYSLTDFDTGYTENSYSIIPSEAEFENDEGFICFTITNKGDDVLYPSYITGALYDQNDNLVYVAGSEIEIVGIHPGSTVSLKAYLDESIISYFRENGIIPARVDSLVYLANNELTLDPYTQYSYDHR